MIISFAAWFYLFMFLSNLHIADLFFWRRLGRGWALVVLLCFGYLLTQKLVAQVADPVYADSTLLEQVEDSYPVVEEPAVFKDETTGYVYAEYSPPPVRPVAMREVDKEKWDDASSGLDYSNDVPKEIKEQRSPSPQPDFSGWNADTAGIGKILQILAIILAIAAIVYGIFRVLQVPRNRRIRQAEDGTVITAENVDAYIHETDLERFLREALAAGNYALCIRLYYLQTIKLLSEKGNIKWSREKTNRDYLREMREHRLGAAFRENTRTFERVWYGNEALNAAGYADLEPGFKGLLGQL